MIFLLEKNSSKISTDDFRNEDAKLIDGEKFMDLLKDFNLVLEKEKGENIKIDPERIKKYILYLTKSLS